MHGTHLMEHAVASHRQHSVCHKYHQTSSPISADLLIPFLLPSVTMGMHSSCREPFLYGGCGWALEWNTWLISLSLGVLKR